MSNTASNVIEFGAFSGAILDDHIQEWWQNNGADFNGDLFGEEVELERDDVPNVRTSKSRKVELVEIPEGLANGRKIVKSQLISHFVVASADKAIDSYTQEFPGNETSLEVVHEDDCPTEAEFLGDLADSRSQDSLPSFVSMTRSEHDDMDKAHSFFAEYETITQIKDEAKKWESLLPQVATYAKKLIAKKKAKKVSKLRRQRYEGKREFQIELYQAPAWQELVEKVLPKDQTSEDYIRNGIDAMERIEYTLHPQEFYDLFNGVVGCA
jgi:hypothetical protein